MNPPWADKAHVLLFEDDQVAEVCIRNGDNVYFQSWEKRGRQFIPMSNYGCTVEDMRKVFGLLRNK